MVVLRGKLSLNFLLSFVMVFVLFATKTHAKTDNFPHLTPGCTRSYKILYPYRGVYDKSGFPTRAYSLRPHCLSEP